MHKQMEHYDIAVCHYYLATKSYHFTDIIF